MSLKYDFGSIYQGNNLVIDLLVFLNNNTSGLFTYFLVLISGIVALYVFHNQMEDFVLSFLYSLYICGTLGTIFYYAGLSVGESLFSGFVLTGILLFIAGLSGFLYYARNKLGGD